MANPNLPPEDQETKKNWNKPFILKIPEHKPLNENKLPSRLVVFRIVLLALIVGVVSWWFIVH